MSNWAILGGHAPCETIGLVPASTAMTVVTAGGSAHTKGSYAELTAATSFQYESVVLHIGGALAGFGGFLIDIAIGAASSEVVVIPDMLYRETNRDKHHASVFLRLAIPAGSRVAARCQGTNASDTVQVALTGIAASWLCPKGFSVCTAYGVDTASTRGTEPVNDVGNNSKSAYAEMEASTAEPIREAVLVAAGSVSAPGDSPRQADIAIGAASSEVDVIDGIPFFLDDAGRFITPHNAGPFPLDVPPGSRLAVRHRTSSSGSSADRNDYALYGLS